MRKREDRDRALLDGGTVDVKHVGELQHELETLERRQGSLEDSLLEIMQRRETLQNDQAEQVWAASTNSRPQLAVPRGRPATRRWC